MKTTGWVLVVSLSAIATVVVASGCGSKSCGPASCANGCCDSSGNCVTNTNAAACGTSGAACAACQAGQTCSLGVCHAVTNTGGGTGGGSSTGGGTGTGGGSSTGGGSGTGGGSSTGGGTGTGGGNAGLIGTWTLTTTPNGSTPSTTTVIVGQDSLNISGPDFTFTAIRTNNTETYTDNAGSAHSTAQAVQTAGTFNTGVIPFSMGGTWVITAGDTGNPPTLTCNLSVTPTEIDATCVDPGDNYSDLNFIFTTTRSSPSSSVYGDFGGTWNNTWYNTADAGSMDVNTCVFNFGGSNVATCTSGNHPLANIVFTLNAAQTMASGSTAGAEFSAVKQ